MTDNNELSRFSDSLIESEGFKNQCDKCRGALIKIDVPLEGYGSIANSLPYMYCERCDLYCICYEEEDD